MCSFSRLDALRAANLSSRATTELMRFGSEGNGLPNHPFGTQDPTVELAKALTASARIERKGMAAQSESDWAAEIEALSTLIVACEAFISDWSKVPG